jgi:hypothetical protein
MSTLDPIDGMERVVQAALKKKIMASRSQPLTDHRHVVEQPC